MSLHIIRNVALTACALPFLLVLGMFRVTIQAR
ncbi:hypothetical protein PEC301937_02370 [Pectobacterium carotovorum subsp. carotovorum]|nr:hypothetical protein PEC301937_02370 [Pectobacterium carotovorum subsp. carotovorum]